MTVIADSDAATNTTFTLAFETGDAVLETLDAFIARRNIRGAHFTGLGAFAEAQLAFYDLDAKEYQPLNVDEQTEVASFTGNVALYEGEPRLHVHAVLARRDGSTIGGHLLEATVRPTLEVTVTETTGTLQREYDEASGLPLLSRS